MDYKQKLEYQSNYWYNDGLKKAQIRDLSGAIVSLKRSLQFNRENITARNLLGLVYYGRGEVAEALVEWIISKNFRASENIASYYISKVQDNPSELEKVNQAVHKYNQCLGYCRQNGEDLAIIQLKKVVVAHPSFLKAYQLLALLYMHSGQYSKARQSLKTALKLDVTNDITLRYMHELNRQRNRQVAHIKEEKHGRQSVVTYNLGNETIIQPKRSKIRDMAQQRGDSDYVAYIDDIQAKLGASLEKCWDGDRFIRGIREDGVVVGAKKDPEASMWLNPQSWAVISGFASKDQAEQSMESVHRILNTPYGIKLLDPPYRAHYFDGALMHIFNPDTKENGGIFSQSQGWAILAESLLGHGNRAFEYFMESSPAAMNDRAEIRVMEPYVHGQFTESTASPYAGRSHVHWLTGTASTVMVGCVEGICGMRPNADGLVISPSIPSSWDGFTIEKNFRGKHLSIRVENPSHVQSGVKSLTLNGKELSGDFVPAAELKDQNEITVVLG